MARTSRASRWRRGSSLVAAALLMAGPVLFAPAGAHAASTERYSFNIATGPLEQSLRTYMQITGRQILYPAALVTGRTAPALKGDLDPDTALRKLVAGMSILAKPQGRGVYILTAGPVQAPPQAKRQISTARPRPAPARITAVPPEPGQEADIVVTGTNIRAAGRGASPVITMSAEDIDRSGRGTVAEALALLPQNFGGTGNENTSLIGSDRVTNNLGIGSTVNLRGLGSNATLTLVNGRRVAGAGGKGDFTDLTTIPTAAVERIEVLADGASALYGSDAIGGVVNLILRKDFQGAESRVRLGTVTSGGSRDIEVSQVVGLRWSTGHFLAAYEYQHRGALAAADRAYTRSADLRPLGGGDYRVFYSLPGTIVVLDPVKRTYVPAYAIPPGQDGTALHPGDFTPGANLSSPLAGVDLLPDQKRHSVYATAEQELGSGVTFYVEGRYANRHFAYRAQPSLTVMTVTRANPYYVSPTGAATTNIAYLFSGDIGPLQATGRVEAWSLTGGVKGELGGDWQVDAYGSRAHQVDSRRNDHVLNGTALNEALGTTPDDPLTSFSTARDGFFNPYGNGHSNSKAITDFIGDGFLTEHYTSTLTNGSVIADGSLFSLPGGRVRLAVGAQARREDFTRTSANFVSGTVPTPVAPLDAGRSITALFGELAIPLVGKDNAAPGLRRLDLSLALRGEHYSDFGSTLNPKFGLVFEPVHGLALRASYGTSFRAPALLELNDVFRVSTTQLPAVGGGNVPVLSMRGGNTGLAPEKARSLSLGAIVTPSALPGFTAEVTWYQTEFSNRIGQPVIENTLQALTNPIYAPFVTLVDPANSPADRAKVLALITGPGSSVPATYPPENIRAIVDGRYVNSARVNVRGLDILLSQRLDFGAHHVALSLNSTVMVDYQTQLTPVSPIVEQVGTLGNPVDFKARASADWSHADVGATLAANYVGSYTDNISVPARPIAAWTGIDLQLRYEPHAATGWRRGLGVSLSVQNLFDRDPPFVDRNLGFGYDPANADVLGRFVALQMRKRW